MRAPYLPQRWLSEQMRDITGSPIVDIRYVANKQKAASYVAKYVSKEPQRFIGCKRYWRSLDWIVDREEWNQYHGKNPGEWIVCTYSLQTLIQNWLNAGYGIIYERPDYIIGEPGG